LQWTGIPVSVGIGATKTLAKLANDIAKKKQGGIYAFSDPEQIDSVLKGLGVQEVWGIGSQLGAALHAQGIDDVLTLKKAPDNWIKQRFSVTLLKTVWELRGISCLSLHVLAAPRKSITCSRSFGSDVSALEDLEEALASYTAQAAQTLREEGLLASVATIFLTTSLHHPPVYSNSATQTFEEPTHYTPRLIALAKRALHSLYRKGYIYKKVGIILGGIVPQECYQPDLFYPQSGVREKQLRAMDVCDAIHQRFGTHALRFAAEGIAQRWRMKRGNVSPRFTTCWDEILTIPSHSFKSPIARAR
jgi:DNA polymerase V